jgi:hypothetical protein
MCPYNFNSKGELVMKKIVVLITAALTVFAFAGVSNAEVSGSKAAANVSSVALFADKGGTHSWDPVLSAKIHTGTQKDLLIGVSLETALYTDTLAKSSGGTKDTSNATAGIQIKVLVDGKEAAPGVVTYDKRSQTLSATLGGYFANCTDVNGDGITDLLTECDLLPEEIQLILDTMAAHHFNFVISNLPAGDHSVEVQTEIKSSTSSQTGSASAYATIGKGSLTIEEIRATNAPDGIVFQ